MTNIADCNEKISQGSDAHQNSHQHNQHNHSASHRHDLLHRQKDRSHLGTTSNHQSSTTGSSVRSEEELHWFDVMRTFLLYGEFLNFDMSRRQKHLDRLSPEFASLLPRITDERLGEAQEALNLNMDFFEEVVRFYQETTRDWADRSGTYHGRRMLPDPYDGPSISVAQQVRTVFPYLSLNSN
jgi:hypothetical protein